MTTDWADVFAEFYIAYPGRDPFGCTIAVFEALLRRTQKNKKWVDGRWEQGDHFSEGTEQLNREELIRQRFKHWVSNLSDLLGLDDDDG